MLVKCKEGYEEVKGGDVGRVVKVGVVCDRYRLMSCESVMSL